MFNRKPSAKWTSNILSQEAGDTDWVSFQPQLQFKKDNIMGAASTTAALLNGSYSGNVLVQVDANNYQKLAVQSSSEVLSFNRYQYSSRVANVGGQATGPKGVTFSTNGTKMYIVNDLLSSTSAVFQYTLSSAWDVSSASYANKTLVIGNQAPSPKDIRFNNDGTRMFIVGSNYVYQYTLSTPWDVATASYANKSFYFAQDFQPEGIEFSSDGTRMFMVGDTSDNVYQYTLPTAWDLTGASYANKSLSVTSQDTAPTGIAFNSNGTLMFIVGSSSDTVYQYTLPTAWDLTGASYSNIFSVNLQDTQPAGIALSSDNAKIYIVGTTTDSVYQYNARAATISDFSSANKTYTIVPSTGANAAVAISSDGVYAYTVHNSTIFQHRMTTPWDISTATYIQKSASLSNSYGALFFKPDGTRLYHLSDGADTIYQYNLAIPWDLDTLDGGASVRSTGVTSSSGLFFKPDGTKLYFLDWGTTDRVYEVTLSTPWAPNTATTTSTFSVNTQTPSSHAVTFSPNGLNMYVMSTSGTIYEYALFSAWVVATAVYTGRSLATSLSAEQFDISKDGRHIYIATSSFIYQWTSQNSIFESYINLSSLTLSSPPLSIVEEPKTIIKIATSPSAELLLTTEATNTKVSSSTTSSFTLPINNSTTPLFSVGDTVSQIDIFDMSSAAYASLSYTLTSQETSPQGIAFNNDGTRMFIVGLTSDTVYQYRLSTPWNVSTAVYVSKSLWVGGQDSQPRDIAFSSDGTKMFMVGTINDSVYQYTLPIAWDLTNASYASKSFSVSAQEGAPQGIAFNNDGTRMFMVGTINDTIYQYTLSTAWDVSTGSYASKSFGVSAQDGTPTGIAFSSDGTLMFIVGDDGNVVYQFTLPTAWDLTGASYNNKAFSVSQSPTPSAIAFSTDGTKMFVLESANAVVYQYNCFSASYSAQITSITSGASTTYNFLPVAIKAYNYVVVPDKSISRQAVTYTKSGSNLVCLYESYQPASSFRKLVVKVEGPATKDGSVEDIDYLTVNLLKAST